MAAKSGIAVAVRCSLACDVTLKLSVSRAIAKKLGSPGTLIATKSARFLAGGGTARVKIPAKYRKRLLKTIVDDERSRPDAEK